MIVTEFGTLLTDLTGQVRSFQKSIENEDVQVLVKDADTCETALKQLYGYAERQNIDINQYYPQLLRISDGLQSTKVQIQRKIDNGDVSDYPLLMQSLGSVNTALS